MQLRPRLGFAAEDLRPIDGIERVGAPVLVIAGAEDRHTALAQSRRLFTRAQAPKELWEIAGAGHVDFHQVARDEYEARVGALFDKTLRVSLAGPPGPGVPDARAAR